jgi:hypothetical protein
VEIQHGLHFTEHTYLPNGLILEEMRDLQFIIDHQEKLQGKYDALVEFGSTPGGVCAFKKDLCRHPDRYHDQLLNEQLVFLRDVRLAQFAREPSRS